LVEKEASSWSKIKKYRLNLTVKPIFGDFDQLKGPGFPKDKA